MAALRSVDFSIDRVSEVRLAGIDLSRVRSFDDLGFADAGRLALAFGDGELPLDFRLHLRAENPEDNATTARLVRMDWTLRLQGRETLSGVFDDEVLLPPGQPTDVPIDIALNLVDFYEGNARDLFELALALAGQESRPTSVEVVASPIVNTAIGPIRYPRPITIVSRTVGGAAPTP